MKVALTNHYNSLSEPLHKVCEAVQTRDPHKTSRNCLVRTTDCLSTGAVVDIGHLKRHNLEENQETPKLNLHFLGLLGKLLLFGTKSIDTAQIVEQPLWSSDGYKHSTFEIT